MKIIAEVMFYEAFATVYKNAT